MTEPLPPVFNRKNPLLARISSKELLTEGCETKRTWHLEIDLLGSGLSFTPGDSLALLAQNDPTLANELIETLGFSGDETVLNPAKEETTLTRALVENYIITTPDKKLLRSIAEKAENVELSSLLDPEKKKDLADHLWGRDIIDILQTNPEAKFEASEFVGLLKKLNVRLYSIASSLAYHPDRVDLTVAVVEYESHDRKRQGVCSSWISERAVENSDIPCFITPGKGFRLPDPDEDVPIIMCGPGTGIAPFRAFLQERKETSAKGDAWLIFGEIHEQSCYFYKDEWEKFLEDGTLSKVSTAWSRDQDEKVYVQHKIIEEGARFWSYLERGAIFYVCGDAERMAPDVDKALHQIIMDHGSKSEDEAAEYVSQMKANKRYRRDVY
tara:strand:- start:199 stop:1347 length:1149 start_codon:yes stop_codon:yes gene_type:complete